MLFGIRARLTSLTNCYFWYNNEGHFRLLSIAYGSALAQRSCTGSVIVTFKSATWCSLMRRCGRGCCTDEHLLEHWESRRRFGISCSCREHIRHTIAIFVLHAISSRKSAYSASVLTNDPWHSCSSNTPTLRCHRSQKDWHDMRKDWQRSCQRRASFMELRI